MSSENKPRQPGLTRRKLAAGFIAITALVSSVALVAQPAPPPEPTAPSPPIDLTFPDPEAPIVVPDGNGDDPVIETVRVVVTCSSNHRCAINASGAERDPFVICRDSCPVPSGDDEVYTVFPGGLSRDGEAIAQVRGFRREDPTTREIVAIPISAAAPDNHVGVEQGANGRLTFDAEGDAGIDMRVTYAEATPVTSTNDTPALLIVLVGLLLVGTAGVGLFALYAMVLAILGAPSPRVRNVDDDDEEDEDEDLPVDAPLALAQPVTKEVAQERAEVARDLLDRVRDIDDPRLSIQTGFSLLETGFGRVHLARRRNETSGAYVTRVFGDHEDLRPTMREISQIFERARFSDLPVDAEMRTSMIDRLAEVKDTWEQEVFLLSEQVPAPPTVLSAAGVPTVGDQPIVPGEAPNFGGDEL